MLDTKTIQNRLETAAPLKSIEWVGRDDKDIWGDSYHKKVRGFEPKLKKWLKNIPIPVRVYLGGADIIEDEIADQPPKELRGRLKTDKGALTFLSRH